MVRTRRYPIPVLTALLVIVAFTFGIIVGGALSCGIIDDLRTMLDQLLAHPDDEKLRALIRATLNQENEK